MVTIKSEKDIAGMKAAGEILADVHRELRKRIKPGVTPLELDEFVEEYLLSRGATPEQKGYMGYPYATCASVNDEICHGFPTDRPLEEGDIITVDMVVRLGEYLADSAWSYEVGEVSEEKKKLLRITKEALYRGIQAAKPGNRIGDISHAIQEFAEGQGYSVVRDFVGHGIGKVMHEDPQVPHFGRAGRGPRIQKGMVFTIEPMINQGDWRAKIDENGWTARTVDGSMSAQYEHTLAITDEGAIILTDQGEEY